VSSEDIERYETEAELQLYREYRDVLSMFRYVVETERRFYLANEVNVTQSDAWVELELADAWVWDMHRTARFVTKVRVLTQRDVNIEEISRKDDEIPPGGTLPDELIE
jgi:hypothetical protein